MGERLKPAVCKIAARPGYAGSNPAPATTATAADRGGLGMNGKRRRPGEGQAGWSGTPAHIAQMAEHALGKGEVAGSTPAVGSIILIS